MKKHIIFALVMVVFFITAAVYKVNAARSAVNLKLACYASKSIKETKKSHVRFDKVGKIPKNNKASDSATVLADATPTKKTLGQADGKRPDDLKLCFSSHVGLLRKGRLAKMKSSHVQKASIEKKLHQISGDGNKQAILSEARRLGMERLKADRQAFRRSVKVETTTEAEPRIQLNQKSTARRTELLPLPPAKLSHGPPQRISKQERAIERLTQAAANADNPIEYDRLKLRLAAAHVGSGEWDQARAIYEELIRDSTQEGIRQTALLNLNILENGQPSGATGCNDCPRSGNDMNSSKRKGGAK